MITSDDIKHLAKLANLPISDTRLTKLISQIETTFEYINTLEKTNTDNIPETNQVTGLHNIWREDLVTPDRMLTQEQALSNANNTYQGYFVVPAILE